MSTVPGPTANPGAPIDSDVERLHQLGYAEELRRRMGGFSNFAVSFTIISVLSGASRCTTSVWSTAGPWTSFGAGSSSE